MAAATPPVSTTPMIALVGNPNCGKTALFNRLTGARQKVGNYAGVTVERKEGQFISPAGQTWRVLDLPGAYSLLAATPDEAITRDVIAGVRAGESRPVGLVCVVDATNLRLNLRMVLELQTLDVPMVLVLNMMDQADAARSSTSTWCACGPNSAWTKRAGRSCPRPRSPETWRAWRPPRWSRATAESVSCSRLAYTCPKRATR
jgi:small GTP-binding protein